MFGMGFEWQIRQI
jgi:ATP-dependent RNA helicase DDX42